MESITPPDHPIFHILQRSLFQRRLLQKVTVIAPAIKDRITVVTRESQHVGHAVIETSMTRTAKKLPGYIRWEMDKKEG